MWRDERGYLMVALLVAMSVMAIMMGMLLPAWRTLAQREKEAELIFRGEQYARAIALFQRRYANATPPDIDVLVRERFLRKKYKDPITNDDFQLITPTTNLPNIFAPAPGTQGPGASTQGGLQGRGAAPATGGRQTQAGRGQPGAGGGNVGGVIGVVSKSTDKSFRLYNGRDTYNLWLFMPIQQSNRAGGPGGGPPGLPQRGGGPPGTGLGPGQRGGQGGPRGGLGGPQGGLGGPQGGRGGRGAQPQNPPRGGGRGF